MREYKVWQTEEENALRAGVVKHGTGAWEVIRTDPEYNAILCVLLSIFIFSHDSVLQCHHCFRRRPVVRLYQLRAYVLDLHVTRISNHS